TIGHRAQAGIAGSLQRGLRRGGNGKPGQQGHGNKESQRDIDAHAVLSHVSRLSGRAGTPTTVIPGATSRLTTAPAPVRAPSPRVTGAISIVSQPTKTWSP